MVETADKGKVNFITNMIYQKANEYDMKIHERVIEGNKEKGFEPEKVYADSGYISGASIREYRKEGQELMGYIRGENTPKPEDFKVEKFEFSSMEEWRC